MCEPCYCIEHYEATALASRTAHDWQAALEACSAWLADEPFSQRPALMGSYIGFRPEYLSMAEQFATAGLCSDGTNIHLLNNRAVVRVYQGKINAAYKDVQTALHYSPARDSAHLLATLGLIAFRCGMPELGREYYGLSIAWFKHAKEPSAIASAALYLLREEIRIDPSAIPQAVDIAQRIAKYPIVMREPELAGMTELLLEEARSATSNNTSNDRAILPSAGREEFARNASLFRVPKNAKQIAPRLGDYLSLL